MQTVRPQGRTNCDPRFLFRSSASTTSTRNRGEHGPFVSHAWDWTHNVAEQKARIGARRRPTAAKNATKAPFLARLGGAGCPPTPPADGRKQCVSTPVSATERQERPKISRQRPLNDRRKAPSHASAFLHRAPSWSPPSPRVSGLRPPERMRRRSGPIQKAASPVRARIRMAGAGRRRNQRHDDRRPDSGP